jgi:hypothetical protein
MQIDAVEQRAGQATAVALQQRRRAGTVMGRVPTEAAEAGMRVSFPTFLKAHSKRIKSKFHIKSKHLKNSPKNPSPSATTCVVAVLSLDCTRKMSQSKSV